MSKELIFLKNPQPSVTYQGGYHGGAVGFQVTVDNFEAINCNCSIYRKKGFIHLLIPPENFTLIKRAERLTTYTFNTHTAQDTFCAICGIHCFYHPRSHPVWFDVNLHCLDEDLLSNSKIQSFDGANWEENVDKIRHSHPET